MKSLFVAFGLIAATLQVSLEDPSFHMDSKDKYSTCFSGREQSPIDITRSETKRNSRNMKMELSLNDQTLTDLELHPSEEEVLVAGPFSKLRATDVLGDTYDFESKQFHFHAPAEHTIDGKMYDLELHIVHAMTDASAAQAAGRTQRNLAVVGLLFQVDNSPNAVPNDFIDALPLEEGDSDTFSMNINKLLRKELASQPQFFSYKGSLTTPPCSELVNWYLFEKPVTITQDQLDRFNERWVNNFDFAEGKGNNRAPLALNGRFVQSSRNFKILPFKSSHLVNPNRLH